MVATVLTGLVAARSDADDHAITHGGLACLGL